ncbi:Hypothetical protein, putative, partial [Bodo saltans]
RGVCRDALCVCRTGAYGSACERDCPGGYGNPCSGNGTCSSAGLCTCNSGYFGTACESACPGGATTPCNFAGECQLTGSCACYSDATNGYYTGNACASCAPEYAGASCNVSCPASRGRVNSRRCICLTGFVGDDCSLSCPMDAAGLFCANHGTCSLPAGALRTPTCACDTNYFGTACSVYCVASQCQANGLYRAQCNPTTGACECRASSLGQWTGSTCSDCIAGYWGDECSYPCLCSSRGTCTRNGGVCQCYQGAATGFWGGSDCSVCATGYTGVGCNIVNVALNAASSDLMTFKTTAVQRIVLLVVSDFALRATLVQDSANLSFFRVLRPSAVGITTVVGNLTLPAAPVRGAVYNVTHYRFVSASGLRMFYPRGVVAALVTTALPLKGLTRRHHTLAACNDTAVADMTIAGDACTVMASGCGLDAYLECDATSSTINSSAAVMSSVVFAAANSDGTLVVLVGDAAASATPNWVVVVWSALLDATVYTAINADTDTQGAPLACALAANVTVCAVYVPNVGLRLARFSYIDVNDNSTRTFAHLVSLSAAPTVTALVASVDANVGIIGFHTTVAAGSLMYLFQASTLVLLGSVASLASTLLSAASIDNNFRLLFLVLDGQLSTAFRTLNLFGVRSVYPSVVDFNGGATITVRGIAFPTNTTATPIWCNVSNSIVPATVFNDAHLECATIAVTVSSGACAVEPLSLFVSGDFAGRSTQRDGVVGLLRPVPAQLTSAVTIDGYDGYGSYEQATYVTLTGFGFVSSAAARCVLQNSSSANASSPSAETIIYETSDVVFVGASSVRCFQPAGLPVSSTPTVFRYSHDGVYFGQSTTSFQIVGPTKALIVEVDATTVVAAAVSTLPTIRAYTTDAYGNRRLMLEDFNYSIRCSSLEP